MLKGNKGEWSELYVLVTLLAEGVLHQSDFASNRDLNNVYEIIKAYKSESGYDLEFDRKDNIQLYKTENNSRLHVGEFSKNKLLEVSKLLLQGIREGKGSSFSIINVNSFLSSSKIQKLKADSKIKADIKLKIYDHRLAKETDLGFSIKSLLGGNSTLFNTGVGNNFIFSIENKLDESVRDFNVRTYTPPKGLSKLTYRLQELEDKGLKPQFEKIQSRQLWKNLKMVDGDMPEIMAWALYYRWTEREPSLKKVAEILENKDPLNFYDGKICTQNLYEYKLKRFLTESAMGMTSETPWLGEYDSFGGVILAKEDGDIVCFHIYDFNLFRNYLLNNTMFEQAATGEDKENPGNPKIGGKKKYNYGWLFEEQGNLSFKINLQVRFK